jgi:hypothetical protein
VTDEPLEPEDTFREVTTGVVLGLLLIGAAVGVVILFRNPFNLHGWSDDHREFAKTSPFILWAALMCAQTALWLLVLVWLLPSFREVWPEKGKRVWLLPSVRRGWSGRSKRLEVFWHSPEPLASTVVIGILVFLLAYGSRRLRHWPDYFPGHDWKVPVLTAIGVLVGLFAAWGIWLTHAKLTALADQIDQQDLTPEGALHEFLIYQARLKRFLGALGAILGLLVLATAAHRQTVLAYDHKLHCTPTCPRDYQPIDYGYQLVLIYGLFFSILIAAVYLPTHLSLTNAGNQIRDKFFAGVPPSAQEWQDRTANREKLGSLLELDVGPLGRLKASAAILTPLISGLIGLLLT